MVTKLKTLPDFKPRKLRFKTIPVYQYDQDLKAELEAGTIDADMAKFLYEQMLAVRAFEEMILALRSQAYQPLAGFDYRGPTHLSIGQEGVYD